MNGYDSRTPRFALAVAAIAMTTIMLAVAVVVPARLEAATPEPLILDASRAVPPLPTLGASPPASAQSTPIARPGAGETPRLPCERRDGGASRSGAPAILACA
jgi:hypothetical protein